MVVFGPPAAPDYPSLSSRHRLMAVAITGTPDRLDIGVPRRLSAIWPRPSVRHDAYPYDVSADGQRFVVNTLVDDPTVTTLTLVLDWRAGLRAR
jgi:hypothetical protein